MELKTVPLWFQCSYISISDGDTLGLDGGLTGHAAASLLQWHLPVCESGSLGTSGPRGSRPVPIRGCHTVCCHVHGCHQVGQLALVLRVRLGPAGGVGTHGSGFLLDHSQLKAPGGWKNKRRHHCAERQKIRDNRQIRKPSWFLKRQCIIVFAFLFPKMDVPVFFYMLSLVYYDFH